MPVIPWSTTGTLSFANTLYRILATPNGTLFIVGRDTIPNGYVWKSINEGTSWTAITLASIAQFTFDITYKDNNTLFVSNRGLSNECTAAKSINAGDSWSDLPNAAAGGDPYCILYDIENSILYMGADGVTSYIYKSLNDGTSWSTSFTFPTANANPRQLIKYGSYIYVINNIGKVYKSLSGSDSWSQLSALTGVLTAETIYVDANIILVGGKDTLNFPCVWRSLNGGTTWAKFRLANATGETVNKIIKVGNYYGATVNQTDVFVSLNGYDWTKTLLPSVGLTKILINSDIYIYANRGIVVYKGNASELFISNIPQNVTCVPSTLKNTLNWDIISDATSYNIYWTKNKIKNEYFKTDLSRWTFTNKSVGETANIVDEQLVLDIPNSVDGQARIDSNFNIDSGNCEISLDLISYIPDDASNGINMQFRFRDASSYDDYVLMTYWTTNSGNTHNVQVNYRENAVNHITTTTLIAAPTGMKIIRNNNFLTVYFYRLGEWKDISTWYYGSRANNLLIANIFIDDRSLNGGSVIIDNFIIKPSVKEYIGNSLIENFDNLDNWVTYTNGQGETATIVSNQLQLYLPDSKDSYIYIVNNNQLPEGGYEYEIDLNSYTPNSTTDGFRVVFRLMEDLTFGASNNAIEIIVKQTAAGNFTVQLSTKVNTVSTVLTPINIATKPEKIKVIKISNIFYIYYYDASTWFLLGSRDFGSYSKNIIYNILLADDTNLRGGTALIDTLLITSFGIGTKISGITEIPYEHNVTDDDEYIYNITSINLYGESLESDEVFGSPTLLLIPQNPYAIAGIEQVTIGWDSVIGATGYNIYWDTSPGVTISSNKIEDVTSPHIHQDLGDYTYYYRISATLNGEESDLSDEVYADPWYGPPASPTNFNFDNTVLPDSECTLFWDLMDWTDSYNVYYIKQSELDELERIKKTTVSCQTIIQYGIKLENVISPLNLINLTAEDYYFIVTGCNIKGECSPCNILIVDIKFDGKIFNHTEQMLNKLLQQYKLD